MALFLDNIGDPDIDFGSGCCIYQLLNYLKIKIDGFISRAEFIKATKETASINSLEGEAAVYY